MKDIFVYDVPNIGAFDFLETEHLYWLVLLFSFLPVFALSFDKKVHYYTYWRRMLPIMSLVAFVFIVWDILFTKWQVWGFNPRYHGHLKIFNLPLEEVLFFFIIPFASVFIYLCLKHYKVQDYLANYDRMLSLSLVGALMLTGILSYGVHYTSVTCILTGGFVLFHYLSYANNYRTMYYLSYLITWIPFLIVDGALTGMFTQEPVVLYNPEMFSGVRVISIPVEDSIYGFLLVFLNVWLLEKFNNK